MKRPLLLVFVGLLAAAVRAAPAPPPVAGRAAPGFTRADVAGKSRTLTEFRGRSVTLLFFCGCTRCAAVAREWGQIQRSGELGKGADASRTVIVYSGDADGARALVRDNGMDLAQTILLTDPDLQVTADLYRADPCPRIFVLDKNGVLRYTNDHADDEPKTAPALALVSRTVDALRAARKPQAAQKTRRPPP